jgi:DNA-binding transcriptional regulator YiaG
MQGALRTMELRDARAQLHLTQQELAQESNVAASTISNCERGQPIIRMTAYALLEVINKHRVQRGMLALTIEDLDWKVR